MTLPIQITDHLERIRLLEIDQFRGRPNTVAFLDAVAAEVQAIEDMLFDVILNRFLGNATGVQLDVIGRHVGLSRDERDDEEYRSALAVQITLNRAGGEIETIIQAVVFFAQAEHVQVQQQFPAGISVEVEQPVADGPAVAAIVEKIKAAGVTLHAIIEVGTGLEDVDFIVADEAARLALTIPPLEVGSTVLQSDTCDIWEFQGGDPSLPGNWTLVGPPFVLDDLDGTPDEDGKGLADLDDLDLNNAGILSDIVG